MFSRIIESTKRGISVLLKKNEKRNQTKDLAEQPRERNGLFMLKDKEDACADIIAVHGLGGDAYDTWTESGKLWLRDFLPSQIPKARIMSYGYNSKVAFSRSVAGIDEFAEDLLNRLNDERETPQSKKRPIIFICHSLGGIVVKKALIIAHERSNSYGSLLEMIKGIVFMGTPHRGSDIAYWSGFLARALHSAQLGTATNTKLLPDLEKNSKTLADISTQFIERSVSLIIRTFYEVEIMSPMSHLVVDKDSARLNLPTEISVPIQANHRTMCKFSDMDGQKYKPVWRAVKSLVGDDIPTVRPLTSLSEKEMECLRSLYTSTYDEYKERVASRIEGTCTWFLKHEKYLPWLHEEKSSLLWVSGNAGCGKTVLSSFLIDEIKGATKYLTPPPILCFFFFDDKIESQKDANAALCGLLHQIILANPSLIKHAMANPQIPSSTKALWDVFKAVSTDPEVGNITCIIDALDECEDSSRQQLIKWFVDHLTKQRHPNQQFLKVLVTSRPYKSIEQDFRSVPNIRLRAEDETESTSEDVALVIKWRVLALQSFTGCSDKTRIKIEQLLTGNADRTFLWVSIVLELLEASAEASDEALERLVTTMPKKLEGVYDTILHKIPSHEKEKAMKVLNIIVGARRPLSLTEFNIALGIRQGDRSIDNIKPRLEPDIERTVKGLCGPFVRVIDSKVVLVHQTAKEFLVQPSEGYNPAGDSWKYSIDPTDSNLLISKICIWYLLLSVFESDPLDALLDSEYFVDSSIATDYVMKHDFIDYAARNWAHNFKEAQTRADPTLLELVVQLCDTQTKSFSTWSQVYWGLDKPTVAYTTTITSLMVGSYFGHDAIVQFLIDKGAKIDEEDDDKWVALHWAAFAGRGAVVQLLADKGAKIDAKTQNNKLALHLASAEGHETAVRLLVKLMIQKGVKINVKDIYSRTPLMFAEDGAYTKIVQFLPEQEG